MRAQARRGAKREAGRRHLGLVTPVGGRGGKDVFIWRLGYTGTLEKMTPVVLHTEWTTSRALAPTPHHITHRCAFMTPCPGRPLRGAAAVTNDAARSGRYQGRDQDQDHHDGGWCPSVHPACQKRVARRCSASPLQRRRLVWPRRRNLRDLQVWPGLSPGAAGRAWMKSWGPPSPSSPSLDRGWRKQDGGALTKTRARARDPPRPHGLAAQNKLMGSAARRRKKMRLGSQPTVAVEMQIDVRASHGDRRGGGGPCQPGRNGRPRQRGQARKAWDAAWMNRYIHPILP